jgi:hypothetical protein
MPLIFWPVQYMHPIILVGAVLASMYALIETRWCSGCCHVVCAAARLHHVNVDRLLFLYQASSGFYQGTSLYVPFPSSAACGSNTEQCGYTYEARVPRSSISAFSLNTTASDVSVTAAAAGKYGGIHQPAVSTTDGATQALSISSGQPAYELQEELQPSDDNAADASRRVVANSAVERFVAAEDTAGRHIGGDPASHQARDYLRRWVI